MIKRKRLRRPRASAITHRLKILDAALSLFADKGYAGASTRAIAAAAGMEQGHLAYYFNSKEALWREVIITSSAVTDRILDEGLRDADLTDPLPVARTVLTKLLYSFAENHRLLRLMLQEFSVASFRHERVVAEFGRPMWLRLQPLFEALHGKTVGSKREAKFGYFAMLGSALVFFGAYPEVRQIADFNPIDKRAIDDYVKYVIESVLLRPSRLRPSGRSS